MKNITILIIGVITLFLFSSCEKKADAPYVIMLSMDGFRWDYTEMASTPNFDHIAQMGVKAESLKPSFPTKTFPNHYSMATGLYPDHHGIVHNSFIDPPTGRIYSIGDPETRGDKYFYGGEPIWITAEKQGVISGSYFWVGSDVEGLRPTYWKPYDHTFPYEQRIDSVIAWLSKPEKTRPHFITWYFPEPDITGHNFGPESAEMATLVAELDQYLGDFMTKLEQLPIADQVNVIVTADHGMTSISTDKIVRINEILPDSLVITYSGSNPVLSVDIKDQYIDYALELLKAQDHIQAWKTGELPERLHYGTNPRTLDIVIAAENHWSIFYNDEEGYTGGTHGYDNDYKEMHAIFYAYGPNFKENEVVPTFENVSIYALIAKILNINPVPTDGNINDIMPLLK